MPKQEIFYDKEKTRPVTDLEVDEDEVILRGSWKRAEFFVFGDSKVQVIDDHACVYARDNSRLYLKNNARVYGHDKSAVYRHRDPDIHSYNSEWDRNLVLRLKPSVTVWLFDNSSFCSYSYTCAFLRDFSTVTLYKRSMVWRDDPELPLSVPVLPQVCHCCGKEMT